MYIVKNEWIKWISAGMVLLGLNGARAQNEYNQILDRMEDPVWSVYGGYVTKESVQKRDGDVAISEWGAHSGLVYFRTGIGDLDLKAELDWKVFIGSGGMNLPDEVGSLRLKFDYITRLDDGYALRLRLRPGFYGELTEFDGNALFFPFGVAGVKSIGPSAAGLVGLNFYPGFKRLIVPELGVRWAISDFLLVDAFYPESRVVFRPNMDWALRVGFSFPDFVEYRLSSGDDRRAVMLDEMRMYAGVDYMLSDGIALMFEAGRVVNRSIDFRKIEGERDVDDALYFRIAIGGLL